MAIISSVKAKLGLSFAALTAVVLSISILSIAQLEQANEAFANYVEGVNLREELASELLVAAQQRAIHARNLVLVSSRAERDAEHAMVSKAHNEVGATLSKLRAAILQLRASQDREEQLLFDELARVEGLYGPVALDIVGLAVDGQREEAIQRMSDDCMPLLRQLIQAAEAFMQHSRAIAVAEVEEERVLFEDQRKLLVGACILAIALAIGLGLAIVRSLLRTLGAEPDVLSAAAKKAASGDMRRLTDRASVPPGSVMASLGEMQSSLADLIGQIRGSADVISGAAEELSQSTEQASSSVIRQKQEVEQVATAIHEMAATVQDVARNTEHAAQAAISADQHAQQGEDTARAAIDQIGRLASEVGRATDAMMRLKHESERIGGVLDVIRSVAEQTNLLALNAAIEAARAGDAGRGFAVVADEVRNLAKRTQDATLEIQVLIQGLQAIADESASTMDTCRNLTDQTVEGVDSTGAAVQDISKMIASIQQMMQQIATAAEQQSAVAEEINLSVIRVRDISERSAVSAEHTAKASVDLAELGSDLQNKVGRFRI